MTTGSIRQGGAVLTGVKAKPFGWQCRVVSVCGASNDGGSACRGSGVAAMEWGGAPVKRGLSRSHFPRSSAHVRVCHRSFRASDHRRRGCLRARPYRRVDPVPAVRAGRRRAVARPRRCNAGCGICRPGSGCTSCSRSCCSPAWAMPGSGRSSPPAWSAWSYRVRRRRRCGTCAAGSARRRSRRCSRSSPDRWDSRTHPGCATAGCAPSPSTAATRCTVPDTERNRSWLGRIRYRMGFAGYPTLRLMTLVETGTRGLIGAVLGSAADRDEATLARRLLPLLHPGMVVLLDRAFDAAAFLTELDQTGARFLVRSKSTRRPPVLTHLPDGSFLSDLDGLPVRIIDADLTVTGADGSRVRDRYRLITTLLDHHRPPGGRAGQALPRTLGDRDRLPGVAAHHPRRAGAALPGPARPGAGDLGPADPLPAAPDGHGHRGRVTTRHQPRPGQLHHRAAGRSRPAHRRRRHPPADSPTGQPDLLGVIGRAVLATLLPPRRPRWSTRKVKNATSRYLNRDDQRPHLPTTIASIEVTLHTPSVDTTWRPRLPQAARPERGPDPTRDHHHAHERRPGPTMARPRTRRQARHQAPQHAHPARRMDPARLPHPHRRRHLQAPDTPRRRQSLTSRPPAKLRGIAPGGLRPALTPAPGGTNRP